MPDSQQANRFATRDGVFVERRVAVPDTELLAPRTQIVSDANAYLGNADAEIGRRIADDQLELFVVCHPAEAMLQQFSQSAPDFIALHDLGIDASSRLLAALAAAAKGKLQKLIVRRQGYGVPLATLQFVELQLQPGRKLRVYTTQVDADSQSREQLAKVLLAHSRLAVIMVGELPSHAVASHLEPLRQAIASGPWPNRQILLVPMSSVPSLPNQAAMLAGKSGVMVRTTPQVARPGEAWSFISGAWNRISASTAVAASTPPAQVTTGNAAMAPTEPMPLAPPAITATYAPTQPLDLQTMPKAGAQLAPATIDRRDTAIWAEYIRRCSAIKGVTHGCVFDVDQQRSLAHDCTQRMAERLAAKGAMLHAAIVDTSHVLGLGTTPPDAAITLEHHYLLLRPMPGRPRVALHLLLDRSHGNIGLVRAQLHQIDQALLGNG